MGLLVIAGALIAIYLFSEKEDSDESLPTDNAVQRNRVSRRRPSKRDTKPNGSGITTSATTPKRRTTTVVEDFEEEKRPTGTSAATEKSNTTSNSQETPKETPATS